MDVGEGRQLAADFCSVIFAAASSTVMHRKEEKTTPFGVNLMRSQVLYRAAQDRNAYAVDRISEQGVTKTVCTELHCSM